MVLVLCGSEKRQRLLRMSKVQPTRCNFFSIYLFLLFYMFQAVSPPIIRSTNCTDSVRYCQTDIAAIVDGMELRFIFSLPLGNNSGTLLFLYMYPASVIILQSDQQMHTIISQIITLLHVSTLSCHPQTACKQYLAKLHQYFKCNYW
jgi:hypothetical protein